MTRQLSFIQAKHRLGLLLYLLSVSAHGTEYEVEFEKAPKCGGDHNRHLKYTWGDALTESTDCIGPNDEPYPTATIARIFRKNWSTLTRTGRIFHALDPSVTKRILMQNYDNNGSPSVKLQDTLSNRKRRDFSHKDLCSSTTPARLCNTRYNTTAPMYGVSLTSGQPVTIVQKFPDLLQQVIYEVCESNECEVVRGECTQTYVPYLFLVIPLGPVTFTGQDYVLVESGCVCKPKHYSYSISDSMSMLPTL